MIKSILVGLFIIILVLIVLYWVLAAKTSDSFSIKWYDSEDTRWHAGEEEDIDLTLMRRQLAELEKQLAKSEKELAKSEKQLAESKGQQYQATEEEVTAPDYYIRAMKEDEILNSVIMKAIQDYRNENNDTTKRDAKYMRELLDKRQEALVPVWEMKAYDDVSSILDVIERHINELTDVSDNTYSMPYGWREGFQMYNFHEDENVRMIVMEKLGELGFEITVKETIIPYYLYEVRLEGTVANLVISWGNNNNK